MTAAAILSILFYGLASWRLGVRSAADGRGTTRNGLGLLLGLLALASHMAAHALAIGQTGGIDLHFFSALSLVAFGMAAMSTTVAWTRSFEALGSVVYPIAALALLAHVAAGTQQAPTLGWQLQLHALLALLAYATLAIAAVLALMLWTQERALRQRRLDNPLLRRLPPLTELEQLLFRTIGAGFLLLTAALLTGVMFVENLFAQHLVHKTVLSVLSWVVFGALLVGRIRYGWRGRRAVRWTLWAMMLLLLAFFGSKFMLELVLDKTG